MLRRSTPLTVLAATLIAMGLLLPLLALPAAAQTYAPVAVSDVERQMSWELHQRLNDERAARGLEPMPWDGDLADRAAAWSRHLAERGVGRPSNQKLVHSSDSYRTPPGWDATGENIAWASGRTSIGVMHRGWMQSSGHRTNMMRSYTAVGIGVACIGGEVYATQVFGVIWSADGGGLQEGPSGPDPVVHPDGASGTSCGDAVGEPTPFEPQWGQSRPAVDVSERLEGRNRYETAAIALTDPAPGRLVIASGTDWPDAVAAAPVAGGDGHVLLVERDRIPAETEAALRRTTPREAYVLGGIAAVSDATVAGIERLLGLDVVRIAGSTRVETAALAASFATTTGTPRIADGGQVFDALIAASGGPGPLLLADSSTGLPQSALDVLRSSGTTTVRLIGQVAGNAHVRAQLADLGIGALDTTAGRADGLAAALAEQIGTSHPSAVIASATAWPDALTGAAVAHRSGRPLLLAMPDGSTDWSVLDRVGTSHALVVGGTTALPATALPR
jgi:hypothetical protein